MSTIKEKAQLIKKSIPAVFLALKKKETPFYAKIAAAVTVAYALSPIDLIPDFIPILGYLDDVVILPLFIAVTIKLIPHEIFAECQEEAVNMWQNGKPQKWCYAIPVIVIWFIIAGLIIKAAAG